MSIKEFQSWWPIVGTAGAVMIHAGVFAAHLHNEEIHQSTESKLQLFVTRQEFVVTQNSRSTEFADLKALVKAQSATLEKQSDKLDRMIEMLAVQ
jgi:hypothetical protein